MRIAAIVVIYHPNQSDLSQNIESFIDEVDAVLLWRNSEDSLDYLNRWKEKIHFVGNGKNEYIAKPLNYALNWCKENRFDYLLTMDQDSCWDDFHGFISFVENHIDNEIAVYAPNVNGKLANINQHIIDAETVITSGSLIQVGAAKTIGGFKEHYKIYWVDGEYCYRARLNGYRVVVLSSFCLNHQLGKQTRTIFGFYTSNYSPVVYYFMFRNMFWMHREHGGAAVSLKCILYTYMYNVRGIILGESSKLLKLWSIFKGSIVGIWGKIQ